MFNLKIINKYQREINYGPGHVNINETGQLKITGGLQVLSITGIGYISFYDLGEEKLDGYDYPKGKYGVLIRTHSSEAYARFDDEFGELTIAVDKLGTSTISISNGTMITIRLPELIVAMSN